MLSDTHTQEEAVDLLMTCMEEARELGLPFEYILQQEMEPFGVIPLSFEILRCEVHTACLDLLGFLLTHTGGRSDWYAEKACLARGSEGAPLYQMIQQHLRDRGDPSDPTEDLPSFFVDTETPIHLNAQIVIPSFTARLEKQRQPRWNGLGTFGINDQKTWIPVSETPSAEVRWISNSRLWALTIRFNYVELRLRDGSPADVDAKLVALGPTAKPAPISLSLPKARLTPLSMSGPHSTILEPCFVFPLVQDAVSSFERCVDETDALLLGLELEVTDILQAIEQEELKRPEIEEEGWDVLEEDMQPSVSDDAASEDGWVKASWSGRDEDL